MMPDPAMQSSEWAQEFERLRQEMSARYIAVTAARGGEGVSTVALGLARALAARGPTLLAEGHLRQPALALRLGLRGAGLADWDRKGPLPVQAWPQETGVSVLLAGSADSRVLPESDIPIVLEAAAQRARADFSQVVWDTPPLTVHPELLALASHVDGALVVVEMDGSRVDELHFLRDALARARMPILGSLLNRAGRYWPRPRRRKLTGVGR